jgi:hypothetical protein
MEDKIITDQLIAENLNTNEKLQKEIIEIINKNKLINPVKNIEDNENIITE